MDHPTLSRRRFVRTAALGSAAVAFPAILRSQGGISPNSRLNVACIGVGGRGAAAVGAMSRENLVALCDVDEARAAKTLAAHPQVPRFRDFRRLLDQLGNRIDAVTISTPDHMHFPIGMAALALGKHVFIEKPMAHTVTEARQLAARAREQRVATQMGIQGHAGEGIRLLREWFQAGILGEVRELHSWTDRPVWPQGVNAPDHGRLVPVTPATLDWDLWLGVAAARPYDPAYLPFNWRGYWDFGTGALGDMGCHMLDGGFWALDLDAPATVEASSAGQTEVSAPTASVVTYHFPARHGRPPVKWVWYDGRLTPPLPADFETGRKLPENGTLIVGTKATALTDANNATLRLLPEARMQAMAGSLPPKTIPRIQGGHFAEWIAACKGGPPAGASFDYSARLTETVLLSNVALRARRPITWDATAMKVTNLSAANTFLTKEYRPGFGV